jgi:CheY-like chemotaxis protein
MDRRHPRNASLLPLVLLVEGHEEARAMYALALSASGFNVIAAPDGADAYARAREVHPDIIVADLPTARHDGWAFLHSLKADACTRDIPVVGVSDIGAPCPPYQLAAVLRAVLEGQGNIGA